jgi:hypothetical protein
MDSIILDRIRADVAAYPQPLTVLWIGRLESAGPIVTIVESPETHRRYQWPSLTAWNCPLPGQVGQTQAKTGPIRQQSLF